MGWTKKRKTDHWFDDVYSVPTVLTRAGCKLCKEHQVLREVCMWASISDYIQVLSLKLAEERSWLVFKSDGRHVQMSLLECVSYVMTARWGGNQTRVLWSWKDSDLCRGKLWASKREILHNSASCVARDWMRWGKNESLSRFKAATEEKRVPFLLLLVVQVTDLLWFNDLTLFI